MINRSSINRKGVLIVSFLLTSFFASSQEVNFRRVENAHVIDAITKDTISSHSSDAEAKQELINWKFKSRSVSMIGAVYEVDIKNQITQPDSLLDTVYINSSPTSWSEVKVVDTISKLFFKYGNVSGPTTNVLNQMGELYIIEKDSSMVIPKYVFQAKLERYREWPTAKTTYRLIETPFFFYESDSIMMQYDSTFRFRTFANKEHCIRYQVNDSLHAIRSCEPGNSTYANGSFRHTNSIYGLDFSEEITLKVIACDSLGNEIGSRQMIIPKI